MNTDTTANTGSRVEFQVSSSRADARALSFDSRGTLAQDDSPRKGQRQECVIFDGKGKPTRNAVQKNQKSRRFFSPEISTPAFLSIPRSFRERWPLISLVWVGQSECMLARNPAPRGGQFRLCSTKMRPVHSLVNNKERCVFTLPITNRGAMRREGGERG